MECLEVWRKMSIFAIKMLILQRFCRKEDFRSEKKAQPSRKQVYTARC